MNKERRSFDKEFKKMAVELYMSGKTSTVVGEELGIGSDLVRRWAREFQSGETQSFPGKGKQNLTDEQKQIMALKKALRDAEMERDILKKAVGIFSKGDSKNTGL